MNKKKELLMYSSAIFLGVVCLGLIGASKSPLFLSAIPTVHKIIIDADNPIGAAFEAGDDANNMHHLYYFNSFDTVKTVEDSTRDFECRFVRRRHNRIEMASMGSPAGYAFIANTERIGSLLTLTINDLTLSDLGATPINLDLHWGWHYYASTEFRPDSNGGIVQDETLYPGYQRLSITAATPTVIFDFKGEKPTYFYLVPATGSAIISFESLVLTYKDDYLGGCEPSPEIVPQIVSDDFVYRSVAGGYELYATRDGQPLVDIVVPSTVNDLDVVAIADQAFKGNTLIQTVSLPNSVKTIGSEAFNACSSLRSVTMPGVVEIKNDAFLDCEVLDDVTFPETLTTIGNQAFKNCNIQNLYIPAGVTAFGTDALTNNRFATIEVADANSIFDSRNNCNMLVETSTNKVLYGSDAAFIPDGIEIIGQKAFLGRQGLANLVIPASLKEIQANAFEGCTSLASVTFHPTGSLTTLGDYVFKDCSALTISTLPETITFQKMGNGVFQNCTAITSFTIPNTLFVIKNDTFSGCSSLTNVDFGTGVKTINNRAFQDCSSLTNVDFGSKITSIGASAFDGCTSLTSIHIPAQVLSIFDRAFAGTGKSLTSITVDAANTYFTDDGGKNVLMKNSSTQRDIIAGCDASIIPNDTQNILNGAFMNCEGLVHLTLPSTLKAIGEWAFANCTSLQSVDVSQSTYQYFYSFEDYAFTNCTALETFTFAPVNRTIGEWMFKGCTNLKTINVPSTITGIGIGAFEECTGLTSVTLPDNMNNIAQDVFKNCSSLTTVNLPSQLTQLRDRVFEGCTSLQALTIPAGMTSVSKTSLRGCESLAHLSVASGNTNFDSRNDCEAIIETSTNKLRHGSLNTVIPHDVTAIDEYAFSGRNFTTFTLPAQVTEVAYSAFERCRNMTTFNVASGNLVYDARDNCNGLIHTATNMLVYGFGTTTIPNGVSYGEYAYYGTGLSEFHVPEGITYLPIGFIPDAIFLTKITLPSTLTYIGMMAFSNISKLESVIIPASVTTMMPWAFGTAEHLTVYAEATSQPAGWCPGWHWNLAGLKWYSAAPNYDGNHWRYVDGVPTIWEL